MQEEINNKENNHTSPKDIKLIKMISVGGGAKNSINNIIESNLINADYCISFNTDKQAYDSCKSTYKVLLGDQGVGAGAKIEEGLRLAQSSEKKIIEILEINRAYIYFVIICSGGGTGSGGGPEVIRIIKDKYPDSIVLTIVTKPFKCEGEYRALVSTQCIQELAHYTDFFMVLNNEKILSYSHESPDGEEEEELDIQTAFKLVDDIICGKVYALIKTVEEMGFMNIDMADVQSITKQSGIGIMQNFLVDPNNLEQSIRDNLSDGMISLYDNGEFRPLSSDYKCRADNGALVYIEGASITTKIMERVLSIIKEHITTGSKLIPGIAKTNMTCLISEKTANELQLDFIRTIVQSGNKISNHKVLVNYKELKVILKKLQIKNIPSQEDQEHSNPFMRYPVQSKKNQRGFGQMQKSAFNFNLTQKRSWDDFSASPSQSVPHVAQNTEKEKIINELQESLKNQVLRIFIILAKVRQDEVMNNNIIQNIRQHPDPDLRQNPLKKSIEQSSLFDRAYY